MDPAFFAAITAPGLKPGDILPPVKSAFGWHVIQIMYHPTDADHLKELKTQADGGADFAPLARDNSEAPTASIGGDLGWIAKGQLSQALTDAIFATPIGKTSEVTTIDGDGSYLFKVFAEETRTPAGRQLQQLKRDGVRDLVQRQEGGGDDHARPNHHGQQHDQLGGRAECSTRSSRRRGFAGDSIRRTDSRWSPARRSSATPIEPSRPLLVVPLATLRADAGDGRRPPVARSGRTGRARSAGRASAALPGRAPGRTVRGG